MDENKSTPAPSDKDAGGNEDDFDLKSTEDHSQDDADKDAAETQADDANNDDDQPSKSTDDKSDSDDSKEDSKDDDAGDKDAPASKFDDDLDEWADKRGYGKLETDLERRLAQDARNNQRDFSRERQAEKSQKDIDKAIKEAQPEHQDNDEDNDDDDPAVKEAREARKMAQEERNLRLRSEFFTSREVTDEESKIMGEILKEKIDKAPDAKKQDVYSYWTDPDNLEDWHALARAKAVSSSEANNSEIQDKAARKERERIAKEHQANSPARNASKHSPSEKTEAERRLDNFSNWED